MLAVALAEGALLAAGVGRDVVAWIGAAALLAVVALAAIDATTLVQRWRRHPLSWVRRLPAAWSMGRTHDVEGTLSNPGPERWRVRLFDHADPTLAVDGLPLEVDVAPASTVTLRYRATPSRRGHLRFEPAELRLRGPIGLCERRVRVGAVQRLPVYPDFAAVTGYAWLAADRRLAEIGIKSMPQRGSGIDFKQLADYRPDDPVRHIDWKASLRHGRPIVREYQEERDQRVVFLLDCGRRMRAAEGDSGASHFDAALDALVLLAWVALKDGDEVGALTFGGPPGSMRMVAPRKGVTALPGLVGRLFDVEPEATQPDFQRLATDTLRRLPKRSLLVLLTNFRDESADELGAALALLRTRHLVLVASLRERALRELAEQPLVTARDAVEVAGAHLFAQDRQQAFARLAAHDQLMLDVEPERLAVELVNRYHAVKRAGLL